MSSHKFDIWAKRKYRNQVAFVFDINLIALRNDCIFDMLKSLNKLDIGIIILNNRNDYAESLWAKYNDCKDMLCKHGIQVFDIVMGDEILDNPLFNRYGIDMHTIKKDDSYFIWYEFLVDTLNFAIEKSYEQRRYGTLIENNI